MATIRKRSNRKGITWQIDYYDPQGQRVMKCFPKRVDAEAYLGKVVAAKKEGRYHDVFDVKKETRTTFNELAARYVENFKTQRSFIGFKDHVIRDLQEAFADRRLSEISYLDLETYRNHRKTTPTKAGRPIHVVCTTSHPTLIIITVYEPTPPKWVTPVERGSR